MKTILITCFTFLQILSFDISNAQKSVVSATKMNVMYFGVENPIEVAISNYSCEDIVLKTNSGSITGSNCNYIFKTNEWVNRVYIYIYRKEDKELIPIDTNVFIIKKIPNPEVSFYIKINNKTYLNSFALAHVTDFNFEETFDIVSFNFSTKIKGEPYNKEIIGNKLDEEIINILKKIEKGQLFTINKLIIKGSDGTVREIEPIIMKMLDSNTGEIELVE